MKNYCYIYLCIFTMALYLSAKKAIPYSGEVCIASPYSPHTPSSAISSDSYAQRFAKLLRCSTFPKPIS